MTKTEIRGAVAFMKFMKPMGFGRWTAEVKLGRDATFVVESNLETLVGVYLKGTSVNLLRFIGANTISQICFKLKLTYTFPSGGKR